MGAGPRWAARGVCDGHPGASSSTRLGLEPQAQRGYETRPRSHSELLVCVCVGGECGSDNASGSLTGPTVHGGRRVVPASKETLGYRAPGERTATPACLENVVFQCSGRRVAWAVWRWRSTSWRARERTGHCGPGDNAWTPPARDPGCGRLPCPPATTPNGGPPASLMNERSKAQR